MLSRHAGPLAPGVFLSLLSLVIPLAAQQPASLLPEITPQAESEQSYALAGTLSLSYRARTRASRNDEDLYGFLSLDGGDRKRDDVTFHLYGRATFDLDRDSGDRNNLFTSLNDIGGDALDLKLYEAFVELRRSLAPSSLGIEKIRLGRQNVHAGYTYLLDGARLDFQPIEGAGRLRISVFGGVPEFLYEASRRGDWLAGASLEAHPFASTRVDLRYIHVEDRSDFTTQQSFQNDFAELTVRQMIGENAHLQAGWSSIDAGTRDVSLSFHWDLPDADLSLDASYRWENDITREFTAEFDPFRSVLGQSFAYHQFQVQVSKLFGDLGLDLGVHGRVLQNGRKEGPFNREFIRAWASVSVEDFLAKNLDLSLTGELWAGTDDQARTLGAEITWDPEPQLRISAGTYYSLYKFDLFVVDERQDATTLFFKLRWKFAEDFRFDARYEFETGDTGDFQSVLLGLTWSF